MKSGIKLVDETLGDGNDVQRQHIYLMRIKMWLNQGQAIRWTQPWGMQHSARLEDDGETLVSGLRVDRESLFNGLFYGIEGMRVGGTRKLRVSPHLAYGGQGVAGLIPANAVITVEVSILEDM